MDNNTQLNSLQFLLDKIAVIDFQYKKAKQKNRFNIFDLLSRKFDEVNLHSRLIYELLNPKGTHDFGNVFLMKMLLQLQIEDFTLEGVEVHREYRKIDLLIKNKKQAIVIENKLWAIDQPAQLQRYYDLLVSEGYQDIRIFYLSLDGKEPEDYSIGNLNLLSNWNEMFGLLSYEHDINKWLECCIKECYEQPILRETLIQYKSLVQNITGKTMNNEERNEIVELLSNNDNIVKAKKIAENWKHVRWVTENRFWKDFEKVISEKYSILDFQKYSNDTLDSVIFYTRNKNPWYGLMFKIDTFKGFDACIFIERGEKDLYYGLALVQDNTKKHGKASELVSLATQLAEVSEWGWNDHWMGGNICHPEVNFSSFSGDTTLRLLNGDFRRDYINKIWTDIEKYISQIKPIMSSLNLEVPVS